MWFILSLIAMLAWAGSDFFSKRGTKPEDKNSHLKLIIVVGTAMLLHAVIFIIVTNVRDGFAYEPVSLIKYLPVSAMYIISMAFGYAGLRYIELSVSSPICNSSGAVVCILCFALLGQRIVPLQIVGVALICAGVLLLALLEKHYMDADKALLAANPELEKNRKYKVSAIAIILPILYCLIDSLGTFMDVLWLSGETPIAWLSWFQLDEEQANLSYEFTFAICAVIAYLYLRLVKKQRFSYVREGSFDLAAVCETGGQFAYVYAIADTSHAGMAAPMIASYCVFSVLLSRIFLKEKLKLPQYAVILAVVIGIAILGIFDAE
jgi:drug/metabolite transporter (DMT)-like permease